MDCSPLGSLVHGASPGKNTEGDCHSLLQGIFLTQELIPGLPHCRQILYCLSHQGSPQTLCKTLLVSRPFSGAALRCASALGINTEATWVCAMSPGTLSSSQEPYPIQSSTPIPIRDPATLTSWLILKRSSLPAPGFWKLADGSPRAVHMVDSPLHTNPAEKPPHREPTGNQGFNTLPFESDWSPGKPAVCKHWN